MSKPKSTSGKSAKPMMAPCNTCIGEKRHRLLYKHSEKWSEEFDEHCLINGEDIYEMLQCGGCGRVCVCHTSYHSEISDDYGRAIPNVRYYPPPVSRRKPTWTYGVHLTTKKGLVIHSSPQFVESLLEEIYVSMQSRSLRVAAMGIRALIETVMIDKITDHGSFSSNLDALMNKGFIAESQKETLLAVIDFGSATIHRGFFPQFEDIESALDITEAVIAAIYIYPLQAEAIRDKVPPRPPRVPKKKPLSPRGNLEQG